MVFALQSALVYVMFVLAMVPKCFTFKCIGKRCLCIEEISIVDCSRAAFESTPQTKKRMVNYTHLSLRHNLLWEVNFTLIVEQFPDVKTVDIRDNPIHCEGVEGGEPFDALRPTKGQRPTAPISSTTEQYLFHNQTQPLNINTTTSAYTEPNLTSSVYLTTLITSIILIPFIIICLRIVVKLLIKRRRRQRGVMNSFEMISFNLETSDEEEVIFDATAL